MKLRESIEIGVEMRDSGTSKAHVATEHRDDGGAESVSPRMSVAPPALRPDYFRHIRCAPAQPVPASTAYESLGLYAQAESSRKSPDRERRRWRRGVAGWHDSESWEPVFGYDLAQKKRDQATMFVNAS